MLVLERKLGESVMIGDDIEIKVHEIHRGKVRLAIAAPEEVKVHRKEIYEAIQREEVKLGKGK